MSKQKIEDEEKKNELLTEICLRLEVEVKKKLGKKISRLQVTAYNAHHSGEFIGEVIFGAKIGFWEKLDQRWKLIMGGFDARKDSLKNRPLTDSEKSDLEKFIFNFCCLNSLIFKPTN